jgi:autotransporter passenger strand-loop-strand repeat protein
VFGNAFQSVVSGTTTNTVLSSGGHELVSSSGIARSTTVSSGGQLQVLGGVASNATVLAGDLEVVSSGGTASNTTVSGGSETVSSGGTLNGATISNGGSIEIESGGTAGSSTITISSGTLILDQAQNFSGTVAGLATSGAQNIDLVNVSSANLQPLSYTDSGGSGTLMVTDGTTTVQLHLIGAYTVGSFKTSADGTGGTIITDPPVSSGSGAAPPH